MGKIRFRSTRRKIYGWGEIEKSGDLAYDIHPFARDGIWLWVEKPTRVFIDHSDGMFNLNFDSDAVQVSNPHLLSTTDNQEEK